MVKVNCDENFVFSCVCVAVSCTWKVNDGQVKTLKCFHCNITLCCSFDWRRQSFGWMKGKGQAKGAEISECAEFLSPKRFGLIKRDKFLPEKCNHVSAFFFQWASHVLFVTRLNRQKESGRRSNRFFWSTMVKHSRLLVTLQNYILSSIFAFAFNFHLNFELCTQCSNCKKVCALVLEQL